MYLKRTVTEDIGCDSLLYPLCQLSCPYIKKWLVDFHAWVSDITQKSEIGGDRYLKWQIRFPLTSLENPLFFSRASSDWPCIHHNSGHVVLTEKCVQSDCMWLFIKFRMAHLYCKAYFWRPEIEKSLQLYELPRFECRGQLSKNWATAPTQPTHPFNT